MHQIWVYEIWTPPQHVAANAAWNASIIPQQIECLYMLFPISNGQSGPASDAEDSVMAMDSEAFSHSQHVAFTIENADHKSNEH